MAIADVRVTFLVLVSDSWLPVDDLLVDPAPIAEYLSRDRSCCAHMGGFYIETDGRPWNNTSTLDEFDRTAEWLPALTTLLRSQTEAAIHIRVWEESDLVLQRSRNLVEIEDKAISAQGLCQKVCFELDQFIPQMIREAGKFSQLMKRLHEIPNSGFIGEPADWADGCRPGPDWDSLLDTLEHAYYEYRPIP